MFTRELAPRAWARKTNPQNKKIVAAEFPYFSHGLTHLFDELARDFDLSPLGNIDQTLQSFQPRLNFVEKDKTFEVSLELPGIKEKEIEISLEGDTLSIRGEKKDEKKEEKENVYHLERSYGSFQRTILLPSAIKEDEVKAVFENGVLNITLPKTEAARQKTRRIEVETA